MKINGEERSSFCPYAPENNSPCPHHDACARAGEIRENTPEIPEAKIAAEYFFYIIELCISRSRDELSKINQAAAAATESLFNIFLIRIL